MKYIKLFEDIKEDIEIINEFMICFQELIDKEFEIKIRQVTRSKCDFSKKPIVSIRDVDFLYDSDTRYYRVEISKHNNIQFSIKNIIDDLLTVESYMKGEFNLIIENLYLAQNENYYKSIENLPTNDTMDISIEINFTKNNI